MNKNLKEILKRIIVPRIPQIALILLLLLISTGIQALMPWPFKFLIDNVLGNELIDTNTFLGSMLARFTEVSSAGAFVVISYFSLTLLGSIADYIYMIWNNLVIQRITRAFAAASFDNLVKLDYSYFRKKNVGSFIYKLNSDVTAPADIIESSILPIISSGLYLAVTIFILGNINLVMAGISLAALPLLSLSMYFMNKKISHASDELENKNGTLYTYVEQVISQLKIIQAYTQQKRMSSRYDHTMWTSLLTELKLYRYTIILTLINGILIGATYTAIVGIGIQRVDAGLLSTGLLMIFIFYLDNIVSPVVEIIEAISSYKQSASRLKNTADIFDTENHLKDAGTRTAFDKNFTVKFDDVSVKDNKGRRILSHINFETKPGRLTAIVGKSGSGKSSIFHLLLRLTDDLAGGDVMIGGYSIREYAIQSLRGHIAYVPQETELFDESISDIISFGKEDATEKEIKNAADRAQATQFIEKRPGGFSAKVGEGGNLLSGGERQRLLLARAYLRDPDVYLMDEIFSAQDVDTQGKMMEDLRKTTKDKTVIMITHTYSVLSPDDYVIVIDGGRIVAEGRYQELNKHHKLPSQDIS